MLCDSVGIRVYRPAVSLYQFAIDNPVVEILVIWNRVIAVGTRFCTDAKTRGSPRPVAPLA